MGGSWIKAATRQEIGPGRFKLVELQGRKVVLYNVDGSFYATDNTCAHRGGPLGHGIFQEGIVTCPWHAWQFDVRSGQAIFDPGMKVATFPVKVDGDDILVEV